MKNRSTTSQFVSLILAATWIAVNLCSLARSAEPELVSVTRIWDQAEHSAFTDLIRFQDRWYCTFREAQDHGPSVGRVRVITAADGEHWESAALVEQNGVDLRDPKLSIMPDGRLMLIMGGSVYDADNRYNTRAPRVSFSGNGRDWTAPRKLLAEDHWLWRVTWRGEWGWSVSKLGEGRDPRRGMLYRTRDGLQWEWITEFRLPDNTWNASETTLRFLPDGEMIALVRPHWIGASKPPYTTWSWTKMKENIGGPNFIRLPNGQLWASGRHYGDKRTTVLARLTRDSYDAVLTLPSGGDCSYPGMVWHDGLLWISYYSSHEGKTNIYLAKIRIPEAPDEGAKPNQDTSTDRAPQAPDETSSDTMPPRQIVAATLDEARVTVTGHDFNRPDPFPGAGDFGWAGNIEQLADGRLMLVHQWGYWHVSFAEPRLIEPETAQRWRASGWPLDFKAPTGGRAMFSTSHDGGRTWSKPQTLIDLPQDDSPYGLLRLKDGTLLCFINVQASWYGYDAAPRPLAHELSGLNTQQCVVRSTDDGKTWSDPIWLKSPGRFYERSHAQPIELADGGILWPTYCLDKRDGLEFAALHRSDDGGRTWRLVSTVRRDGKPLDEPAIARLGDGRLMMVCRPDGAVFHSSDDGATWSETGAIPIRGTLKAPRLFVLTDGTILCAATVGTLCAFISSDHGRTWTDSLTLDDSSYGYPGGMQRADDSLLVSYVQRGNAPSRIYVVRFRVNDTRDGIELLRP